MAFCTDCGHQLPDGAKFCFACGAKVDATNSAQIEERKTVYDGELHKCPNCGSLLDSFELRCKFCGYELRGNKGSSTVQKFADEIKRIEQEGGKGVGQRIITHISTFPIPNSKEELLEFLILSSSKINVDRYKEDTAHIKKEISDAWSSKFEQAYYKALIAFANEPTLSVVQEIYKTKTEEIKKHKRAGFFSSTTFMFIKIGIGFLIAIAALVVIGLIESNYIS